MPVQGLLKLYCPNLHSDSEFKEFTKVGEQLTDLDFEQVTLKNINNNANNVVSD